jgi:hypothetical protein
MKDLNGTQDVTGDGPTLLRQLAPSDGQMVSDGHGGVYVTLTDGELALAIIVGVLRNLTAKIRRRAPGHALPPSTRGLNLDMSGAIGELGTARWRNAYWAGSIDVLDGARGDVDGIGVRTVARDATDTRQARLIVQADDPDDRPFLLVVRDGARCHLVGWLTAREARTVGSYPGPHAERPAWYVDQSFLHGLDKLTALLDGTAAASRGREVEQAVIEAAQAVNMHRSFLPGAGQQSFCEKLNALGRALAALDAGPAEE